MCVPLDSAPPEGRGVIEVVATWLIPVLTGGAVFCMATGALASNLRAGSWTLVPTAVAGVEAPSPRWPRELASRLGRTALAGRIGRNDLASRRLELAGRPVELPELRGLQVGLGIGAGTLFLPMGLTWVPALAMVPFACWAAVRLPEMVVARRARHRQARIAARVPDLVELLLATIEAGLGPAAALARISDMVGGPLGDEVRAAVREVDL